MQTLISKSDTTYYVYSFSEKIEGQTVTEQYACKKPLKKNQSVDEHYFAYSNSNNILKEINKTETAHNILKSDAKYYDEAKTEYTAKEICKKFHRVEIDKDDFTIRTYSPKGLLNFVFFPKN